MVTYAATLELLITDISFAVVQSDEMSLHPIVFSIAHKFLVKVLVDPYSDVSISKNKVQIFLFCECRHIELLHQEISF